MSEVDHLIECDNCGQPLDGTHCRWRCTRCGYKLNCCEGAPQPEKSWENHPTEGRLQP